MTITLRPNQSDAADAIEDAYRSGIRRPLVDSCVGSGKSLIMAEVARRAVARGERVLIGAHSRELVEQNAAACRMLMPNVHIGINAAALGERTWRAPVICAAIQSVFRNAQSFGPIHNLLVDECHLIPHSESGMYRQLARDLGYPRTSGYSGTVFRLAGGSLVEGEGAPFEKVVYRYSILDGIRDGYLVPAFSAPALDKIDSSKLRVSKGEFTGASQDCQTIGLIDNHIAQMAAHGRERRAWLVFEASTKAAKAMTARLNEWGVPTGLVLGETPAAERANAIRAYREGRLRALVNVQALTTGFDVQEVDMLVMRRRTQSLGLYIQMTGRLLRTIGGHITSSIAAGKSDGIVLDFAGNIDAHGPLDFIRPKENAPRLVSCEECGKRNNAAAARCWSCDAMMTKLCPACLVTVARGTLDCPHCQHDMRAGPRSEAAGPKLLETPSGAALIASYRTGARQISGGWKSITRAWRDPAGAMVDAEGERYMLPSALSSHAESARWVRCGEDGAVVALLLPNGAARTSARQVTLDGQDMLVPLPAASVAA